MEILFSKRRAIKGQLTRLETVVASHATQPLSDTAVKTYRDKIDKLTNDLEVLQEAIVVGSTAVNFEANEDEYNQLIDRAEQISIFFYDLIGQRLSISRAPSQVAADIKLPKLELPTFSGNYVDWFIFHDLFSATVHNSALSGAQKLQYLKTSLRGEAALLIQSIMITDGNYDEAWNILLNRYNNTREVIDAHLKRLFNQPSIKEESAQAIRCLIDTTTECIRSLKVLKEPVEKWDAVLLHVVKEKIDPDSRRQWELSLTGTSRPPFQDLTKFLEQRARALMAAKSSNPSKKSQSATYPRRGPLTHHGAFRETCAICKESHAVYRCEEFLKVTVADRWRMARKHSLCNNCLKTGHQSINCKSGSCRKCTGKHNTLLHTDIKPPEEPKTITKGVTSLVAREVLPSQVILATAIIQVEASNGELQSIRALLDSGSQASFISEQCCKKLQLKRRRLVVSVGGIGGGIGTSRGSVQLNIKSNDITSQFQVQALVLRQVTEDLPNLPVNIKSWSHIKDLRLADTTFHKPGPIDVLLGADIYLSLVRDGICTGPPGTAGAFNTIFGWVIFGPTGRQPIKQSMQEIQVYSATIDDQLSRFWELEEICPKRTLTASEQCCEDHFLSTFSRNEDGRYIVRLPLKTPNRVGESRRIAVRRLTYIEKRLQANTSFSDQYHDFMNEYIRLGHMKLVPKEELANRDAVYLPHHAVIKESSTTTKLRVVFDASAKSANGTSLNDLLLVGPKIQDDLITLLLRFRLHAIVMTADIAKMYREILVHPQDQDLQRIVWRHNVSSPLQDYKLLTVTYGTSAGPFLATRVLKQLAVDVQSKYPKAAQALTDEFYMDDLMTGADSTEETLQLQSELLKATKEGGFHLRKWASNDPAVLQSLSTDMREIQGPLTFDNDETIKNLVFDGHRPPTSSRFP